MAFLCVLSFLTYYDRLCINQAQPDICRDFKLTVPQFGIAISAFWLAYGLFEIPGGWMADRFGARSTLSRIVLAWSLFTALTGSALGLLTLVGARFCFGAGEAGAYPSMARVQQRWLAPGERARAGGLLWLVARWGGAFSPLIFGGLLRCLDAPQFRSGLSRIPLLHHLAGVHSWRLGFWVSGLAGLLWVSLFFRWFRDDPARSAAVNARELALINAGRAERSADGAHGAEPRVWLDLLGSASLWGLAILYFCGSFAWNFFATWMGNYLQDVHHVTFQKSPVMAGAPLFFGGISCLVGGTLCDYVVRKTGWRWLGRAIFPMAGCATAAGAMLCIRLVHSPWQAVALMCVASAAYDFGQAANWAAFIEIGGRHAGAATGFANMIGNLGNSAQGAVGPRIFSRFGYNALFLTCAVAYMVAGSMWLIIDPRRTFYESNPPGQTGQNLS